MQLSQLKPFPRTSSQIKLLHVDDDNSQLVMMQEILRLYDKDVEIDSLDDPQQVIERINDHWYDCIITDYQMPRINGVELAEKIRETSSIPIILYTGQGSEDVAERAFSVGINDYFRKEINPQHYQVLAKRIRDLVDKQRIEEIYTNVVKDARNAIVLAQGDHVIYANQAILELIGASSLKNVISKKLSSLLNLDRKVLKEEMDALLRGDSQYSTKEIDIKRRFRKNIPVEMNLSQIEYRGEKVFLCFLRDITERRIFETELKNSETRYKSLLQLAPDGIMTINMRGDITWINEAFTSITGFSSEEIVGKKVWSISTVRPSDIKTFIGLFFDQITGKETPQVEFQWVSKDGTLGWGEGRASLLQVDGKPTEVLLINRDITGRKRLEENLKKYSKEMEQLAEERAEKLVESENLVAAGAIASTVAHDLRGPLSAIKNAVFIMEKNPERSEEMQNTINTALKNAVEMLNDVQEKMNMGVINIENVELTDFIETVANETPIPSRIKLKLYLHDSWVPLDRLKIRRVLENLIRNSIDAIPRNGVIQIRNYIESDYAVVEVVDNGVGVPNDLIGDLFKPFNTTKGNGMGLGLYYCKQAVEAHNGFIEVKSKTGSGTIFTIRIPLSDSNTSEISSLDTIQHPNAVIHS